MKTYCRGSTQFLNWANLTVPGSHCHVDWRCMASESVQQHGDTNRRMIRHKARQNPHFWAGGCKYQCSVAMPECARRPYCQRFRAWCACSRMRRALTLRSDSIRVPSDGNDLFYLAPCRICLLEAHSGLGPFKM